MKGFLFTGRIAVVFNLMFLLCLLLRAVPFSFDQVSVAILVVGGWILSLLVNFFWVGWLLVLTAKHKKLPAAPGFLLALNGVVFLFQLIYFFF